MKCVIRRRKPEDCADIQKIITKTWQHTYDGIINESFLKELSYNEEYRIKKPYETFDDRDNNQFVLIINGKIVGFINIGITDDKNFENCGEIFSIYILKEFQGYGYGRKLIEFGINELKKLGLDKMIIGCIDGNSSNQFYKHLGGKLYNTRIINKGGDSLTENVYYFEKI